VKWVHAITVQDGPSENHFQARAYKIFPPHIRSESADWESGLMLGEFPVNAVICEPAPDAALKSGPVTVRGYAVSGGGRSIERVDVSTDGGRSWATARLHGDQGRWAWRLWEIVLDLAAGDHTILVRGWDSSASTQPEDVRGLWNFKGYMNNAWHRVRVTVDR
jgi:sulfite oxidase